MRLRLPNSLHFIATFLLIFSSLFCASPALTQRPIDLHRHLTERELKQAEGEMQELLTPRTESPEHVDEHEDEEAQYLRLTISGRYTDLLRCLAASLALVFLILLRDFVIRRRSSGVSSWT